jgi:hypothetical protein
MESQGKGDNFETQGEKSGPVTWNSVASSFMLNHLAEMVANGTRTSSGFKKVHLNMCARVLNDHFKTKYSGQNVKNHLRTWQRKFSKILKLKNLSIAGWNEDSYMITLDPMHYADYIIVSNLCTCYFHYMFCITYLSCYDLCFVGPES